MERSAGGSTSGSTTISSTDYVLPTRRGTTMLAFQRVTMTIAFASGWDA